VLRQPQDVVGAFAELGSVPCLLEGFVPFTGEVSLIAVRARDAQLTKPAGALGRLEEIVEHMAAWQAKEKPTADRAHTVVFAGNHGVAARGVSPYPTSVTRAMLQNFSSGGAAVNQICGAFGLGLKVFELALDLPTKDITQEPAMSEAECAATIAFGMEAIAGGAAAPDRLVKHRPILARRVGGGAASGRVCTGPDRAFRFLEPGDCGHRVLSVGNGQAGLDAGDAGRRAGACGRTQLAGLAGGAGADDEGVLGGDGVRPRQDKQTD